MTTVVLQPNQAWLDLDTLCAWLGSRLPGFNDVERVSAEKFEGGQSNPTFALETPAGRYVLRKKPAGDLLPSAHAVEREFAVMTALAGQVPVPCMHLLCEDESVIGEAFFVMEQVEGRLYADARMLEAPEGERRALCFELVDVLARLHAVDWRAAGLESFGKAGGYVSRQLSRLTRQYLSSKLEDNADMDLAIDWLEHHVPANDESTIVHGDFRSYNVLYAPNALHIAAVLDWELSTIGHPLADLAFLCLPYHMPAEDPRGFQGQDPEALGIPSEAEMVARYCEASGRDSLPDWRYFLVFSLFRSAAIRAGVYRRSVDGTAASSNANVAGRSYRQAASAAARLVGEEA